MKGGERQHHEPNEQSIYQLRDWLPGRNLTSSSCSSSEAESLYSVMATTYNTFDVV